MSISDIKAMIQEEKREEETKTSAELRRALQDIERLCERVDEQVQDKNVSLENVEKLARQFVYAGEKIYLYAMEIGKNMLADDEKPDVDPTEKLLRGRYKITGDPSNGYQIIMPMLPRKFVTEEFNQTRIMAEIVHDMVAEYVNKTSVNTPVYGKATIQYEANYGPEYGEDAQISDGDNLDTKHITDALQQLLFPADNLLVLSWKITGKRTHLPTHMRVYVKGEINEQKNTL